LRRRLRGGVGPITERRARVEGNADRQSQRGKQLVAIAELVAQLARALNDPVIVDQSHGGDHSTLARYDLHDDGLTRHTEEWVVAKPLGHRGSQSFAVGTSHGIGAARVLEACGIAWRRLSFSRAERQW
jgi:hypothetical protein